MHSSSKCRSMRPPFTALEDWKLVILAHVHAVLLQVQIQAFTFHCAERLKTRDTCKRIGILAPSADPSVHRSLRWKIENSWDLHTYMHSCSRCRSKRSPFTALKDWKLVILAHVYAFSLLQVQIQAFTFHCAERLNTRDTCTRICILAPGADPKCSPFTALKDWTLVKLAHVYAFLLQMQIQAFTFHCAGRLKTRDTCTRICISCSQVRIQAFTFHCAGRLKTRDTCTRILHYGSRCRSKRSPFTALEDGKLMKLAHVLCILAPGADPSVHLSLRWKIENSWNLHTFICILAPGADPSVHLSLRWKIENPWNLHTYMHSCSRCRFQAFTFHCAERVETSVKLAHVYGIIAPGADPSVHLSLRWKDWNLVKTCTCIMHSRSRCRSKRSPFTALKDW